MKMITNWLDKHEKPIVKVINWFDKYEETIIALGCLLMLVIFFILFY